MGHRNLWHSFIGKHSCQSIIKNKNITNRHMCIIIFTFTNYNFIAFLKLTIRSTPGICRLSLFSCIRPFNSCCLSMGTIDNELLSANSCYDLFKVLCLCLVHTPGLSVFFVGLHCSEFVDNVVDDVHHSPGYSAFG